MNRWSRWTTACAASLAIVGASSAGAAEVTQIGGRIGALLQKAEQKQNELRVTEQQEQEIGAAVSERIRERYGVAQDAAVHKYIALVGTLLVRASGRAALPWKFIVLDTDGVNAFAAPGGYVHVTRGALALIRSEAELAGVLSHEMIHVTEKHAIGAIKKGRLVQMGTSQVALNRNSELFRQLVDRGTDVVLAGFGRAEELEADQKGLRLANQVGYAPQAFPGFLARLAERNRNGSGKQGLFASHPEMQERIAALERQIGSEGLASAARLDDRYRRRITYTPVAQAGIAAVEEGASGLTGSKTAPKPTTTKKGFGLAGLLKPAPADKKSAQVTGSAAARGVDKELGAPGGPVKTIVVVTVTDADLAAFRTEGRLR